jgi:O-antigen ligase
LTVPILGLVTVYFVSGLANGGLKEAAASIGTLRTFIVYFWAYFVFRDRIDVKQQSVPSLLVLGAVAGLVATFQQLLNWHPGYKYLQGTGFLSGPMAFAGVMQMFSLMAIALFATSTFKNLAGPFKNKSLYIPIAIANILGLLFASERSAWMGFFIGMLVIASQVSLKLLSRLIAIGIVVAGVGWFAVPMVQARLLPLLDWQHEPSSMQRMEVWNSAIKQYKASTKTQIIGVGPRKFEPIPIHGPNKEELDHAHSNYLQSLTTTGLIGLLVYLWLCFSSLRLAWQNYVRAKKTNGGLDVGISLGILGGLISLLLAGIFEYNFGTGNVRLAQWFLLAMLSSGTAAETATKTGEPPAD